MHLPQRWKNDYLKYLTHPAAGQYSQPARPLPWNNYKTNSTVTAEPEAMRSTKERGQDSEKCKEPVYSNSYQNMKRNDNNNLYTKHTEQMQH